MTSDTPHRVWERLALYGSTELVGRLYQERHGNAPTGSKAREIVSYLVQGREYFSSAAGAGELVRPVILYYGAMALSRGLILFLDPSKPKVEAGHGLAANAWDDLNTQPRKVPHLPVTVHAKGTFPELLRVTRNVDRAMVPAEGPAVVRVLAIGSDPIPPGTRLTIKEILGQIPDLQEAFEAAFDEHPGCLRCEVRAYTHLGAER